MKPQDVVLILKVLLWKGKDWSQLEVGNAIAISAAEVNHGLKRLAKARLYNPETKTAQKIALLEFLIHGVKYIFPVAPGPIKRGIPTAHSAPPLSDGFVHNPADVYVWEDHNGKTRGQTLEPLYNTTPSAALNDPKLYELLALIDALRVGPSRETQRAAQFIKERILQA